MPWKSYPSWYGEVVREVNVLESGEDGLPLRAETKLHLVRTGCQEPPSAPRRADVPLAGAAQTRARSGGERRVVRRHVQLDDRAGTHLSLELDANMPVPQLVPLGGVGDAFASGFMQAAVTKLESGSASGRARASTGEHGRVFLRNAVARSDLVVCPDERFALDLHRRTGYNAEGRTIS